MFHLLFSYVAFFPPCFGRIFQLYCIYILHEWIMSITFLFYIQIRFVVAFLTVALFFPLWWSAGAMWFLHPFAISLKPIIFNMTTLIFAMLLWSYHLLSIIFENSKAGRMQHNFTERYMQLVEASQAAGKPKWEGNTKGRANLQWTHGFIQAGRPGVRHSRQLQRPQENCWRVTGPSPERQMRSSCFWCEEWAPSPLALAAEPQGLWGLIPHAPTPQHVHQGVDVM